MLKSTQYKLNNILDFRFFFINYNHYRKLKRNYRFLYLYKLKARLKKRKRFNLSKPYLLNNNFWYLWKKKNIYTIFHKQFKPLINLKFNYKYIESILSDYKKTIFKKNTIIST